MSRSTIVIAVLLCAASFNSNAFSAEKAKPSKLRLRVVVDSQGNVEISSSRETAKNARSEKGKLVVFCDRIRIAQPKKDRNSIDLVFVGTVRAASKLSRFEAATMTLSLPRGAKLLLNIDDIFRELHTK